VRIKRLAALLAAGVLLGLLIPSTAMASAPWDLNSVITATPALSAAQDVAVDSAGNTYVTDPDTNRVVKFGPDGQQLWSVGGTGAGDGEFSDGAPRGVAVDSASGDLFVTDGTRVQILSAVDGSYSGVLGGGFDEFGNASDVFIGPDSAVYVSDNVNLRIAKYSLAGTAEDTLDVAIRPLNIAVNSAGTVFITGTYPVGNSDVVARVAADGTILPDIGSSGTGPKQFQSPTGLTVDAAGVLYVMDMGNARIQRINALLGADGEYDGGFGTDPGTFNYPMGLTRDSGGKLYVADVDHVLVLKPASVPTKGAVTGTVTDTAGPVHGASVSLLQLQNQVWTLLYTTSTDTNGVYNLSSVAPGDYQVKFSDPGGWHIMSFWDHVATADQSTLVSVVAGVACSGIDGVMTAAGNVAGTVSDPLGPTGGLSVSVYRWNAGVLEYVAGATSRPDGSYTVRTLPVGSYAVRFSDNTGMHVTQYYGGVSDPTLSQQVVITGGNVISGVDGLLTPGGTVAGTITDGSYPLGGMSVKAYRVDGEVLTWIASTNTASGGTYLLKGLPAGDYKIGVSDPTGMHISRYYGGGSDPAGAQVVPVVASTAVSSIDMALDEGGNVSGTVVSGSTPLLGASVVAYRVDGSALTFVASTKTLADGTYVLKGIPGGSYKVAFSDATGMHVTVYFPNAASPDSASIVSVSAGATTTSVNGNIPVGGVISGTVRDYRGVQAGISVQAYRVDGAVLTCVASKTTAADGTYAIKGLAPASYKVRFTDSAGLHSPLYYGGQTDPALATVVTLAGGSTVSGVDANISPGGTITGLVHDSSGNVPGITVQAYKVSGSELIWITNATTQSNGHYSLKGLPTGFYKIFFSDATGMHVSQYYEGASSADVATPVIVYSFLTTNNIDATLAKGGTISGTVGDGAEPLAGMSVNAYSWNGSTLTWVTSAKTSVSGGYVLKGLPQGNYKISFNDPAGMHILQYYDNVSDPAAAAVIAVVNNTARTGYNATLVPSANVAGLVTDGTHPLADIKVQAYLFDGLNITAAGNATTKADGTYTIKGLGWGSYKIAFTDPTGMHVTQYFDHAAGLGTATLVAVTVGTTSNGVNASMPVAGTVSGTVSDPNGHLAAAKVSAYQMVDGVLTWIGSANTTVDGTYLLKGLPVGSYIIGFADPTGMHSTLYYADAPLSTNATSVSVSGGVATTGVNQFLQVAGCVSGTITDGSVAVADIKVAAYRVDGSVLTWIGSVTTGADGTYVIKGLAAGTYKLGFTDKDNRFATQWYTGVTGPDSATPIVVSASNTLAGINAVMIPK
jgi:5-hydroxyisourate hydrolase-like protein (transthyretin family)